MSNKSLAETVNFGEAVQAKGYEKRAQQVDTFVRSETAEQKLARSGKLQTAKALESLAKLGTGVLDYKAQEREREVQLLKEDLANITATAVEEARQGNKPYDNDTFRNLPVRFQIKVRNQVGIAEGTRAINAAAAGITDEMRLNPDALAEHLEAHSASKEIMTGMDAHEKLGYDTAWNEGLDKIKNDVAKVEAAEGQRKVNEAVAFGAAQIINNSQEVLIQQQEETGQIPTAAEMKLAAASTYTQLQTYFEQVAVIEGVEVPTTVRKALIRDEIIAQAKATGNPYLLAPENIPVEYQDGTTLRAFADARISIAEAREAEARQALSDENSKYYQQVREANERAYSGDLTRANVSNSIELDAVIAAEKRNTLDPVASTKNAANFEDQIEMSIADPQGRGVLLDISGDPVLVNGETVPLNKQALSDFVEYNPNFNNTDASNLIGNMDENLVGFDVTQYLNGEPMQNANTVIQNNLIQVPKVNQGQFETEMQDWYADEYETNYYQAKKDKGWSTPLTMGERKEVRKKTHRAFLQEIQSRIGRGFGKQEVDLDGNTGNTPTETTVDSTMDSTVDTPEPFVPESNQEAYDKLGDDYKETWNKIKDKPELVQTWIDRGLPTPDSAEEKQANYDEVRATVDMTDEELEEMLFGVANYEYGDGIRNPSLDDRLDFKKLPTSTQKVLMDRYINTKASEFIDTLTNFYNRTFDSSLQKSYEKDVAEVLRDPKNVMKMDAFIKGKLKNKNVIQGEPGTDPIPWLDQLNRVSWYIED